jgi:hypothetical protein
MEKADGEARKWSGWVPEGAKAFRFMPACFLPPTGNDVFFRVFVPSPVQGLDFCPVPVPSLGKHQRFSPAFFSEPWKKRGFCPSFLSEAWKMRAFSPSFSSEAWKT